MHFNPRAPCGARPDFLQRCRIKILFQSTRPLRGATAYFYQTVFLCPISIHAPLAGRDLRILRSHLTSHTDFNPRAPCGARRQRATYCKGGVYFNPRAPCGARQDATEKAGDKAAISIHAPLAGRDNSAGALSVMRSHFNPRAPCGARPRTGFLPPTVDQFQSTRPLRGATGGRNFLPPFSVISIHAPLAGRDEHTTVSPFTRSLFQSTRPLRGATCSATPILPHQLYFNPRAPCGARRYP